MALETEKQDKAPRIESFKGAGRRFMVGTNVVLMTVLALLVTGAIQYGGYEFQKRVGGTWDATSASVNDLTDATERLLGKIDKKIWITSLYFESDEEGESQAQYRARMNDLIELYQIGNRSKIEVESINPVKDHEKHDALIKRLSEIPKFRDESAKHVAAIDAFRNDIAPRIEELIGNEMTTLKSLSGAPGAPQSQVVAQLSERLLPDYQAELTGLREDIADALTRAPPAYAAATQAITSFYNNFVKLLNSIGSEGPRELATIDNPPPDLTQFLSGATDRYRELVNTINAQVTELNNLPALELANNLSQVQRGTKNNPLVVSTEEDMLVIPFEDIWPQVDPNLPPNMAGFKERDFRGEEKLTSAILRLTTKEKTAVVFVRFAGQPLFGMGAPFMGQPRGPMAQLKARLEESNFQVEEWDLSTQQTQPAITPTPKRTLYVVLKPTARNPFQQQQMPQAQFGPTHEEAVKAAIASSGRVLFLCGWSPVPGIGIPDRYEYSAYLKENWGIDVDATHWILTAIPIGPGKFALVRDSSVLQDYQLGTHAVTGGLSAFAMAFPTACPLVLSDKPPEGVSITKLAWTPPKDTIWGVGDIQKYQEQRAQNYFVKIPEDPLGPFTLAALAEQADKKIAIISGTDFIADQIALQPAFMIVGNRPVIRLLYPGNVTLFTNILHWLNDNTEWMNIGRPIAPAVMTVEQGSQSLKFWRTAVFAVWPAVALLCGGVVWWVRRR